MSAAKPVLGLADIIGRLDGGDRWAVGPITAAIDTTGAFTDPAAEAAATAAATRALDLWNDLIAIDIVLGPDAKLGIDFSTATALGATYTSSSYSGQENGHWIYDSATVAINTTWSTQKDAADFGIGTRGSMTLLHEIGHALGLDHPGGYNGSAQYAADAEYRQDTQQYTVMSYFNAGSDGSGAGHLTAQGFHYAATPMLHDIAAIQSIFGADMTTRTGNTVYGFDSTAGSAVFDFAQNRNPVIAIWDAGGIDTINASGFGSHQVINLGEGTYSSIGALKKNVAIADGAVIENAVGGRGHDKITGNATDNRLTGGGGNDVITGGTGEDMLLGCGGKDTLKGCSGDDLLYGGGGRDLLIGGAGDDHLYGGAGADTARYAGRVGDYRIHTSGGVTTVVDRDTGDADKLVGIEKLAFKGDWLEL